MNKNKSSMKVEFGGRAKQKNGVVLVPVKYEDTWAHADPDLRKEVTHEIEEKLIPLIEDYIEKKGGSHKRRDKNHITESFFAQSEVIDKWRKSMPTAEALYPLQKPEKGKLADGTEFDDAARRYFPHSLDGEGLRSRAAIMSQVMYDKFSNSDSDKELRWASLACGAAIPVFDAASNLSKEGKRVRLYLADIDKRALEFAKKLATEEYPLEGTSIKIEKRNILRLNSLKSRLGENSFDAIDILGFFEYLPSEDWQYRKYKVKMQMPGAVKFLNAAYSLLKPGGILVLGNMRDTHRQLSFATQLVQWPYIRPRSLERVTEIIEEAGIDKDNVTFYQAGDGVYTVAAITK